MTTMAESHEVIDPIHVAGHSPVTGNVGRIVWSALAIIAVILIVVVGLINKYSPLAQSWQTSGGEYYSLVTSASGVEAHYTLQEDMQSVGGPATQWWNEPAGRFKVEIETEIANTGPFAVQIDRVGLPNLGYRMSNVRVSFYHDAASGSVAGAPFHPYSLASHNKRMIVVDYTQQCAASAIAGDFITGPSGLPVTYSFLGFTHTVYVPASPFGFQTRQTC
jgi:hypothetical protein